MSNNSESKNKGKNKKKVKVFNKKKKQNIPEQELIQILIEKYEKIDTTKINTFSDFPLSAKTQKGLKESGYIKPTEIQRESVGLSLQGKDILGAAQTGNGKTLAFIIPILEKLYCKQWTRLDGLGALIITPTRELAYQIFETLRKVGHYHDFSAGLIIGGKDLKFETKRMDQCNIVICTPGRILQHMDENPLLDCVNMQILVLDEADRCLDMGFSKTMNAIIANLPPIRQTLLFSATQTKSVKDLARLSLKDPSYVSVHEHAKHSTPPGLQQSYVICELKDKISIIWSFIKNHLKKKTIIFFSTCKEVKYAYDMFCKLRPGVSLLPLYGTLHQQRRMTIYETFVRKQAAVLFATDLAGRGLDFPSVDWVVQADCPEDTDTYIHRVGRTARYNRGGESLLLLLPSEIAMVDDLLNRKIPLEKIEINPQQLRNPVRKMEAFLASTPELKETAKRSVVAYVKSVFLMKNKEVFKVEEIDTTAYSQSLGLSIPPRVRFVEKMTARNNKLKKDNNSGKKKPNLNTMANRQNKITTFSDDENDIYEEKQETNNKHTQFYASDESEDDILVVKRQDHDIELPTQKEIADLDMGRSKNKKPVTKYAMAKKMLKKNALPNKKTVFDDSGDVVVQATKEKQSEIALQYENEDIGGIDIEKARLVLKEEDKYDKALFKEKVKAKKREMKKKLKKKKKEDEEEEEKDDFGSDSEYEPDTSWLPDPDKVYRNGEENNEDSDREYDDKEEMDSEKDEVNYDDHEYHENNKRRMSEEDEGTSSEEYLENNERRMSEEDEGTSSEEYHEDNDRRMREEDEETSSEEEIIKKPKKRNLSISEEKPSKKRKKIIKSIENITVNEAENLALMLLNKNR